MKQTTENSAPMITEARRAELRHLWGEETNEEGTRAWRDELTLSERAFVARLDRNMAIGCGKMATIILIMDDIYRIFPLAHIQEISHHDTHCRLVLKDGRVFDCWMDRNNRIQYREEESRA